MLPIQRQFHLEPRFKGIIFRRTYPELESEIIVRSQEWYPHTGARYNQEKKRWTFPCGAIMQFGHMEYEDDARKYDSAEYNYGAFDELTSFTEGQYLYFVMTRIRSSSSRLPAIARSATNPGNVGHAWVRDRFISPAPSETIIVDKKTKLKRIFVQSFAEDNPYLMENDPTYLAKLDSLPEAERRAKRFGDWDSFSGQVFDEYREMPNAMADEPENACHLYTPFEIPSWWMKFLAIDWGFAAMTCALWGALSPDDRLYIYREYTIKEAKTSTWATEIGRLSEGEKYQDIVLCRSAWQNRGEEINQQESFTKYSGLVARMADNNRIEGKTLFQEFLRWKSKPARKVITPEDYSHELAAKILRVSGLDAYKDYLSSFEPEKPEGNLPKLQIHPDCKVLRRTIPLCIYDKKSNVTNKLAEDVREFDGDDPYDTGRYLICAVNKYLGSQVNENSQREKVNEVIQSFATTQDYTAMHRRMEHIERVAVNHHAPVRKYHRVR